MQRRVSDSGSLTHMQRRDRHTIRTNMDQAGSLLEQLYRASANGPAPSAIYTTRHGMAAPHGTASNSASRLQSLHSSAVAKAEHMVCLA